MNRDRSILFSSLAVALAVTYLGGYIYLKHACYSTDFAPSDPWKSSNLTMHSKVSHWGTWDLATMSISLSYRDPGIDIAPLFSEFLNAIYLPLQKVDEQNGGWAVRFNTNRRNSQGIAW